MCQRRTRLPPGGRGTACGGRSLRNLEFVPTSSSRALPQSAPLTAFGPGRKHGLLPALAKNMPPAYFLNASRPPGGSLKCPRAPAICAKRNFIAAKPQLHRAKPTSFAPTAQLHRGEAARPRTALPTVKSAVFSLKCKPFFAFYPHIPQKNRPPRLALGDGFRSLGSRNPAPFSSRRKTQAGGSRSPRLPRCPLPWSG